MTTTTTSAPTTKKNILVFDPKQFDSIDAPAYPRFPGSIEALQSLAESIAFSGQEQPGVVTPNGDGGYRLVCGNRRLQAIRLVNENPGAFRGSNDKPLPGPISFQAIERRFADPASEMIAMIDENAQRKNMSVVDVGSLVVVMADTLGWDGTRIAAKMNLSPARISQLRSFMTLPPRVLDMVNRGELTESAARKMLPLTAKERNALLNKMEKEGLSSAEVGRLAEGKDRDKGKKIKRSLSDLRKALEKLSDESDQALLLIGWIDGEPNILLEHAELRGVERPESQEAVKLLLPENAHQEEEPKPKKEKKAKKSAKAEDESQESGDDGEESQEQGFEAADLPQDMFLDEN